LVESVGTLIAVETRGLRPDRRHEVFKKILIGLSITLLAAFAFGCNQGEATTQNTNSNTNSATTSTTRPGPDNSEITTTVDSNGVRTETRTFRNNPRVSRVVVTTRNGNRTARAYSQSGEEKEVNDVGDVLEVTGDKIADGVGWLADKGEDVGGKTAEGAKTVGEKTAEGAKTVGEKTAEGAKTVGEKTAEGAKKTGKAIKKAVTP
jgi:hypothetical protein